MKKNVLFVFGTRPEAIKLAPLILLGKKTGKFNVFTCSTGQHKEMLKQVLDFFSIRTDYDLDVMKPNQSLSYLTGEIAKQIETVISGKKFDMIVVQGDTTTAFVGALIAYYHKIPVAHIEAGLRTNDKFSPFPEEANRGMISRLSDLNFAPTVNSKENLLKESVSPKSIFVTGNTVIDALQEGRKIIRKNVWQRRLKISLSGIPNKGKIVLVTGHRRESFGKPFENICRAIKRIAKEIDQTHIVYPVHLNPNVRRPVKKILGDIDNISLIEPVSYPEMIYLMERSYIILTDSGGIQEEAPTFGKPVFVMRNVTERPEGIDSGVAKLVGSNSNKIFKEVKKSFESLKYYKSFKTNSNPYGDGKSSMRIIRTLMDFLNA
ncbi:MAG: UDP-N-acetylglucosamine 2-epimerase (non-hydrolyzing) [bacterium]|nr:UDP-N-acetylglucosamine 2-epimerase (non-hydrolyzing) [bacterium]